MRKLLFRLPQPRAFSVSPHQLRMMDLIALREGVELPPIPSQSRRILRTLLAKKLIELLALGPARYKLTPIGRLVRGGRHATRIERERQHSRAGPSRPEETVA